METQTLALPEPEKPANNDYSSNVDTSRPFRSVKEAVAVFGERLLVGEIYSPKPFSYSPPPDGQEIITSWKYYSQSPSPSPQNPREDTHDDRSEISQTLKKLEAELEETKMELKLLKKRESETEIALATLNAELHKNMSKMAAAEAEAAGKNAAATRMNANTEREIIREEERKRELMMIKMESSPTLAQILSINEEKEECIFGGKKEGKMMMMKKKKKKKKPIVPLVTDLFFFKKKDSSTTLDNPLYASPNMYFN
ncbi:hypothetical protein JRO89_XS02G0226000 [Xanthoceras sorbifolium]|uniref:WEB family protein n=1 Tax=Xanthoceras sorbifolium TaxID=99658 RepID=A0ABQ8IGW3_9ROSI|nr:hypothetical protein JRO89_XS02G0226000 [Xanthoceras sorbifolium]